MITSLKAKQILDSRGKPTIEVELETNDGLFRGSVPSGTSRGKYEAKTVRASKAVENINKIIGPKLIGKDPTKQKEIDGLMPKRLGANAILAVSIAVCRAGAKAKNLPLYQYIREIGNWELGTGNWQLPRTSVLLIEGGLHACLTGRQAKNQLDFQEFMVVGDFQQAKKIYQKLGKTLKVKTGMEGGFTPQISEPEEALDLIMEAAQGAKLQIGLDCAASHWKRKKYDVNFYQDLVKKYPIVFLEDPFSQDDWQSWQEITEKLGKKITIVGDDLLTTNVARMRKAKGWGACNGAIIKPNQIGSISETLQAVKVAKSYGWKIMVSHRSGETMDDFIADLAVGVAADFFKSGAPVPPERLSKYRRLLKIEKELK